MKRILLIFLSLSLILAPIQAQVLMTGSAYTAQVTSGTFCAEYQAVYDAMTTKPGRTGADTAMLQNNMVQSLVDGGYWVRMDVFYVLAQRANGAGEAFLCWTDPDGDDNCTDGNSTTWTKYQGVTGNGTDDFVNSNWNPSTEGVNFTQDDATLAVYCTTDVDEDKSAVGAGSTNLHIRPSNVSGNFQFRINSTGASSNAVDNSLGLFLITRTASNVTEGYRNGVSEVTDNDASGAITNNNLYILRFGTEYSSVRVAIVFAMDSVDDTEQAEINTIIETYMNAIGAGVEYMWMIILLLPMILPKYKRRFDESLKMVA